MPKPGTPGPRRDPLSLNSRIEDYWKRNPGEWLSVDDMVLKFCATPKQVHHAVSRLRREGRLDLRTDTIYRMADR